MAALSSTGATYAPSAEINMNKTELLQEIRTTNNKLLTRNDIPQLREKWIKRFEIVYGPPFNDLMHLPPMREVNHHIPLIDPNKKIKGRTPKCPDALQEQLRNKINAYVAAGIWVPCATADAVPLLCIPKKTGLLRTVIDGRERNANTHLDITALPDQEYVRECIT